MKKTNSLRTFRAGVATIALSAAIMPQVAFAQDEQAGADTDPAEAPVQGIIVTGSRVENPNLSASSPVRVVTSDAIDLRQATVVDDFLREIPGISPSIGAQVNNGNGGSTFVDLRGIGANRNLVL